MNKRTNRDFDESCIRDGAARLCATSAYRAMAAAVEEHRALKFAEAQLRYRKQLSDRDITPAQREEAKVQWGQVKSRLEFNNANIKWTAGQIKSTPEYQQFMTNLNQLRGQNKQEFLEKYAPVLTHNE
jgi:hypothetical protein